jgi:hypothetical protein
MVLTVDPMVPPAKVRTSYERIRQKIVGKRFTKLSPEEEPLAERMAVWNEIVPDHWGYGSTSNFKGDAERAVERLLNPFTYDAMIGLGVE